MNDSEIASDSCITLVAQAVALYAIYPSAAAMVRAAINTIHLRPIHSFHARLHHMRISLTDGSHLGQVAVRERVTDGQG